MKKNKLFHPFLSNTTHRGRSRGIKIHVSHEALRQMHTVLWFCIPILNGKMLIEAYHFLRVPIAFI